jgi:translation initiation factor 1
MVCPKCGLPQELCICETIAKETQKIKIEKVQRRYGKYMTTIRGIDKSKIDIKELMKKLKSKLACGGTYKNDEIELQGDHRERVKEILIQEGFPAEIIEVR